MFLTQTYISYSLYMKVQGEIIKNLYTLFFLQQKNRKQDLIKEQMEAEILEKMQKKGLEFNGSFGV